jgi:hypothetical protein
VRGMKGKRKLVDVSEGSLRIHAVLEKVSGGALDPVHV